MTFDEAKYKYMHGLCGVFAYALWIAHGKPVEGQIGIIAGDDREPWSENIPFEPTHVYFDMPNFEMDVCGVRSIADMADDCDLAGWEDLGPYKPRIFLSNFVRMNPEPAAIGVIQRNERLPLAGSKNEIEEALFFIRRHPKTYGLPC